MFPMVLLHSKGKTIKYFNFNLYSLATLQPLSLFRQKCIRCNFKYFSADAKPCNTITKFTNWHIIWKDYKSAYKVTEYMCFTKPDWYLFLPNWYITIPKNSRCLFRGRSIQHQEFSTTLAWVSHPWSHSDPHFDPPLKANL